MMTKTPDGALINEDTGEVLLIELKTAPKYRAAEPKLMVKHQYVKPDAKLNAKRTDKLCATAPIRVETKPSRNAPCPCGSGVKYKRCCR